MAPRKGFSPFTRVISDELLSLERNWYVLTTSICGGSTPCQYFRKNAVVQIFPDEFRMVKRATLRLADEAMFDGKAVSEFEVVASSCGLLAVLFRQQAQKSSFRKDQRFSRLKEFLNDLDFSALSVEHETFTRGTPFPQTTPSSNMSKTRASALSRVPNTEKQMKARGRRPSAFICFEVFGTRDKARSPSF